MTRFIHKYMSLVLLWLVAWPATAQAAGAISQGFQTSTSNIAPGAVLSLTARGTNVVTPASTTGATTLVGVATTKPLLQLSSSSADTIQVAVAGVTPALVTDLNGQVKAGDRITASPVSGIGMKATQAGPIVGVAQANLQDVKTITRRITSAGKSSTIHIGLLPILVSVGYYAGTNGPQSVAAAFIPPFIQDFADAVAGKPVSPLLILASLLILIIGSALVTIMLTTAIQGEITGIGRNPLAHNALLRGLLDVLLAALGVLVITLAAAYLIIIF